jgi:hypothetical protein
MFSKYILRKSDFSDKLCLGKTNLQGGKMNKTVMIIVAIVVLLCMCCVVGGVGAYLIFPSMIGDQFSSITSALGTSGPEALSTVVPTVSSSGKVTFPSSSAASSSASSKASSGVSSAPGAGGIGGLFGSAATKAKTATKYRTQFTWLLGETTNGKYTETPFIDLSGEMDNGKSHLMSKGGLLAMLGGDANSQIEIISADGKTYMKGVKMFGITDPNTWYITDNSTTSGFSDFGKPDDFADFTGGAKEADIKKVRTESLDGQNCDVYLYDMKSAQNAAVIGALGSSKSDFASVDKAEMNVWLCADGFVHKYTIDYQGHDTNNVNEKGALKMNGHMWDFNNPAITVTVPPNAKPMPGAK